jgi:hypothetical protein
MRRALSAAAKEGTRMAERPPRPDPPWEGVIYVAAPDKDWQVVKGYERCRFGAGGAGRAAGPGTKACGKPSVAKVNRGPNHRPVWFAYCDEHMRVRGHWIEFGEVWGWDLREVDDLTEHRRQFRASLRGE